MPHDIITISDTLESFCTLCGAGRRDNGTCEGMIR